MISIMPPNFGTQDPSDRAIQTCSPNMAWLMFTTIGRLCHPWPKRTKECIHRTHSVEDVSEAAKKRAEPLHEVCRRVTQVRLETVNLVRAAVS